MASEYRFAPAFTARILGLTLVGLAVLILLSTALVAVLNLHSAWLLVPAVVALVVVVAMAVRVSRRGPAVTFGDEGYVVRGIRGAGVQAARWKDVEDAITTHTHGSPCVVLRLRNGTATTIPVEVLAGDREEFVRDLQRHLRAGQGNRPL